MNECKILGYARYTSKEDDSEKVRINIAIPYEEKGYNGLLPLKTIFLDYSSHLVDLLNEAIKNNLSLKIDYSMKLASQRVEIIGFSRTDYSNNNQKAPEIPEEIDNLFN